MNVTTTLRKYEIEELIELLKARVKGLELENANLKEQIALHEKITEERAKQFKELEKTCEKWKRMASSLKSQEDIADE